MKIVKVLSRESRKSEGWLDRRFPGHYARISTSTTRKIRSAILDVARATFGKGNIPASLSALCQRIEVSPQGRDDHQFIHGYEEAGEWVPGSITWDPALKEYIKKYPEQWAKVEKAIGLKRSSGSHASGFLVTNRPIAEFMPLTPIKGMLHTEYTSNTADGINSVEAMGAIKLDLLQLKSLEDIQQAIKLIQDRSGIEIPGFIMKEGRGRVPKVRIVPKDGEFHDIWDLPDEPAVYQDVSEGKTETVFQFNTQGAIKWLELFNTQRENGTPLISSISDLAIFTSLDRPGPMQAFFTNPDDGTRHNAIVEYVRRAQGLNPSKDIPAEFDRLFPETQGIMCVSGESRVQTARGLLPLNQVVVGDMVRSEDGTFNRVLRTMDNGMRPCLRIGLSNGEDLELTPDHKVLTDVGWVEAQHLTEKHLVRQYWPYDEEMEVGDDGDWLAGLLLADGHVKGGGSVTVAAGTKDFADFVKTKVDTLFGDEISCRVFFNTRCWYTALTLKSRIGKARNPIISWLRDIGMFGKDCYTKRFPDRVTLSTLAGFFEGDGSVLTGVVRLKNPDLARDFFNGLQKARIDSRLHIHFDKSGPVNVVTVSGKLPLRYKANRGRKEGGYRPNIVNRPNGPRRMNSSEYQLFLRRRRGVRFLTTVRYERYCLKHKIEVDPNPWGRLISKREIGERRVYDLSVEKVHSYTAGGTVVHNCFQEFLSRSFQEMTGCSEADADEFRSYVAKKRAEKVNAAYPGFIASASKKIGQEAAEQLWSTYGPWAEYGFGRSVTENTILTVMEPSKQAVKSKQIKDIVPGDRIECYSDGEFKETEIVALHDHGVLEGYEVEFDDGYKVVCSMEHKFLTKDGMKPLKEIIEEGLEILAKEKI